MTATPKPDWQSPDGSIRLYCADCRDILPTLEPGSVDAVVTDPPYQGMNGGVEYNWDGVAPRRTPTMTLTQELGNPDGLGLVKGLGVNGVIAFCSFHWIEECANLLGGTRKALICWAKRNSPPPVCNVPHFMTEYAWAIQYTPGIKWRELPTLLDVPMLQAGCFAQERLTENGRAIHPTQKPLELMKLLLLPGMDSVCDPYMGLGTTAVACIKTGRRCIGIEVEEKYFRIAQRRCEQALLIGADQLPFGTEPPLLPGL